MLWGEAVANGYGCPIWMTYKQAQELGAQVRKGEHGSLVVYADRMRRTETADNGDEIEREIPCSATNWMRRPLTLFAALYSEHVPLFETAGERPVYPRDAELTATSAMYERCANSRRLLRNYRAGRAAFAV
jgi:hypothetical protein